MPTFRDFEFRSSTGENTIHARMCVPDGTPRAVVQISHGIAEHIRRYDEFMEFLAGKGYVAIGNDHLGHGESLVPGEELGTYGEGGTWEKVVEDID